MRLPKLAYAPLALVTTMASAVPALAQFGGTTTDGVRLNVNTGNRTAQFSTVINSAFIIFTWIAGIAAVFYLLWSGFQYITAGGDGDKAAKARTGIINAIIGIIVLMAAFFIFNAARNAGQNVGGNIEQSL